MQRLLGAEDLRFLRSPTGFQTLHEKETATAALRDLRRVPRELQRDFQRAALALKLMMLQSRHDRPELATVLLRAQQQFAMRLLAVKVRMLIYRWGRQRRGGLPSVVVRLGGRRVAKIRTRARNYSSLKPSCNSRLEGRIPAAIPKLVSCLSQCRRGDGLASPARYGQRNRYSCGDFSKHSKPPDSGLDMGIPDLSSFLK